MVQAWPSPALIRNQAKKMSLSSDQVRPGPINLRHWPGPQNGYMFTPSTTQVRKFKAPGTLVKIWDGSAPTRAMITEIHWTRQPSHYYHGLKSSSTHGLMSSRLLPLLRGGLLAVKVSHGLMSSRMLPLLRGGLLAVKVYSRLDVEQVAALAQGRVVGSEGVLTA